MKIICHGHILSWNKSAMVKVIRRRTRFAVIAHIIEMSHDCNGCVRWRKYTFMDILCHGHMLYWKHVDRKTLYTAMYMFFADLMSLWSRIEICHACHGDIRSCTYYVMEMLCHWIIPSWHTAPYNFVQGSPAQPTTLEMCHGCHWDIRLWTDYVMQIIVMERLCHKKHSVMEKQLCGAL